MGLTETAQLSSDLAQRTAFYGVVACWFIFLLAFALRERKPRAPESKRDHTAVIGMLLEGASYFMVWLPFFQRTQFVPLAWRSPAVEWGLVAVSVAIAACSIWLVDAASHTLGKQWALAARLVEGHSLIQSGPYRFVRNPIYAGMFGILLATGVVRMQWIPLLLVSLLFLAGTYIRIRSEERLLREAFGLEFEAYARKVPALIPGIY